jgi:hypothetical protein
VPVRASRYRELAGLRGAHSTFLVRQRVIVCMGKIHLTQNAGWIHFVQLFEYQGILLTPKFLF